MITGELKNQIDKVWTAFWTGGISTPLPIVEQITFLLFIRRLDELQTAAEKKANTLGKPIESPIYKPEEYHLRWSRFKNLDSELMLKLLTAENGAFSFIKTVGGRSAAFGNLMKDASLAITKPKLLAQVVSMLDGISMHDRDTKGDVYEYLLSKLSSAGINGQFRTPRHIIKLMVEMVNPTVEDIIADPAAGTCGFLVAAAEHIREHNPQALYHKETLHRFEEEMFMGMEFDATMIRIGTMNLILHGIENPQLSDRDALSKANSDFKNKATVILANPPFKGSVDGSAINDSLTHLTGTSTKKEGEKSVKTITGKTELLFLQLIVNGLKLGGRAAVIVPDGVVFGSSNAHRLVRKEIVDHQRLQAVISMPSGVFKPYAGVSTAILLFTRTDHGGTDKVWFYDMQADGFSLDDKRQPVPANDLPDILARWNNLKAETKRQRSDKSFLVPLAEIQAQDYDLSINRYKDVVYEQITYEKPETIIAKIRELDTERADLLSELEALLQTDMVLTAEQV